MRMSGAFLLMCAVSALLLCPLCEAQEAPPPQAKLPAPGPAKGGLASLYPGDEGIERDPRVLFVDDFETGTVEELGTRWGQISRSANIGLTQDIHAGSPGVRSLRIHDNGHLYTHTRNVDTMYARFYVKFHPKIGRIHHFVHLIADRIPTPWPKGGAGLKPSGDAGFSTGIEPHGRRGLGPPGAWMFYTYWHEMKTHWGTNFLGKPEQIEPGRWYCVEAMLKANSAPDKSDGEQAYWVDGELHGQFKGFRWRTSDKLKINSFWLLLYNTREQPNNVMEVWFDDIVIATEYVGPVHGKPAAGKKKAVPSKSALLTPGLILAEPGKVVYSQNFEKDAQGFQGGELADGGVDGSKAFSFGPKGGSVWNAYAVPVKESTTIRFKLKPLFDARGVTVLIWSKKHKDNCRYNIGSFSKGKWRQVEFRAMQCRTGWSRSGPSPEGDVLDNFKLLYAGGENDRLLIDDIEITE